MVYRLNINSPKYNQNIDYINDSKNYQNLFIYFDENCLINTSFGKRKISEIKKEDTIFFNSSKILEIENEDNCDFKNELEYNIVFKNEFNDVLYYYCRDLSNIFKVDSTNNFKNFFQSKEVFNVFSLFIYDMINNENIDLFDKLKEKLKEFHMSDKFLDDESMVVNYRIFNNLFGAYCETYNLKHIENLEQIKYINSKFSEMFLYGLERHDLTKDIFKELFEMYYHDEILKDFQR